MIGLVLQGGGARGSYHVGAAEALLKRGIRFDAVVGTSIGAINGALIASDDFYLLKSLWKKLDSYTIFGIKKVHYIDLNVINGKLKNARKIINNKGIDITNFKKLLADNINESKIRKSKINFGLTAYNITDKKMIEVFKKDIPKGKLHEYVLASSYLPVFKMEKIIDNKYYLDGGVFNNCPLSMLDTTKYEKVFVIKVYKNERVDKTLRKDNVVIISPNESLGSQINFDQKVTKRNMKLGYYDALKALDNLDGTKYYIKYKPKEYYESLFDEKHKKQVLFETTISNRVNEKKIIIKILESLAQEWEIEQFKIYTVKTLISILKLKMINQKKHKYYSFIKYIKLI